MSADPLDRLTALFEQVLELPADSRAEFLDEACAGNADLRREVESLLSADRAAGEFMERPIVPRGALTTPPPRRVYERIGAYRILRRIGEGGMSEVHLGVRADDAYRKHVAVKVIRADLGSEEMLRRFRTERQILATLDHPNIAKLLDGGQTDDGLPYFVMDYIEGLPVDRYCDERRLSVNERVELFRTICSAVQYAHQNLVVHRDIKASNILVTSDGVVKLLDFGIAKLLRPEQFVEDVEHTATWMRPMTPRYASPEQVLGHPITTASDVYSLGVLLYLVLSGHMPYRLEGGPTTDIGRLVVEQEPAKPSTSVTRDGDETGLGRQATSPDAVSRARGTQPVQLQRSLAGDLDTIVLMALRKEPQRRYASVEQLSEDLRRFLAKLPVSARPDTLGYRAKKFLRRRWAAVLVAGAFVALLAGFGLSMAYQASRVAAERDQARRERDRAERVVSFMEELFEVPDPLRAGANLTAREILDSGAERLVGRLEGEPDVRARLAEAIGVVYRNLGMYERARPLLEGALEARRELYTAGAPELTESVFELGTLAQLEGRLDEAEQLLGEALRERRANGSAEQVARALNALGLVRRRQDRSDSADRLYREAIGVVEGVAGGEEQLAMAHSNLGALLLHRGEMDEAERRFRIALDLRIGALGPKHPLVGQTMSNLGATLGMRGRLTEAEPLLAGALDLYGEVLGREHPKRIEALNNLAKLRQRMGRLDEAELLLREAIDIESGHAEGRHPDMAHLYANLADLLRERRDWSAAGTLADDALELRRELLGPDHPDFGRSLTLVGQILVESGQCADAEPILVEAVGVLAAALPTGHWRVAEAESLLGASLIPTGRRDEGLALLSASHQRLREAFGPEHVRTRAALARLEAVNSP